MANTDFSVLLKAELDRAGIDTDLKKVQEIVKKYHLELTPDLQTASLKNQFKSVCKEMANDFNKAFNANVSANDVFKVYESKAKQLQQTLQQANKIQLLFDTGSYQSKVDSLVARTNQWVNANGEARISTESLQTALSNLGTAYNNLNSSGGNTVANQQALIEAEKALDAEVKRVQSSVTSMNATMAKSSAIDSLRQKVQQFYDINTASHGKWGNSLKNIMSQLASGTEVPIAKLKELERQFITIQNSARQAGKLGLSFIDGIKEQAKKFTQWVSVTSVVMEGVQVAREMYQAVYDIDTAMTELAKVSDTTNSRLQQSLEKSIETAKKYGSTVSDVVSATADWSRLGYNMDDAEKLAEVATIYKNVGDGIDISTANESLISTLQGFGKTAEDAMHIIDSFNEVANNFAIDSNGIGQALQRSASSMSAAGNTMEETIGLITAANGVVQDPESVGTAFKTISMRIRGAKTELEEMGEDTDGMVESTAKLQEEIMALSGVDIMKDKNTFKSTYQIMDELSQKWKDLTDIQRASITELIAGKRQGNIISALMTNFDVARQATETAIASEGSAMKEQETYLSSLEAKTKQFEASFQSLSNTILDSDLPKFFVDIGTTGVKAIDGLVNALSPLGTAALIGGGILGGKNLGKVYKCTFSNCFEYALYA